MIAAVLVAAVLLGIGLGSLFHAVAQEDWLAARVGTGFVGLGATAAIITAAVAVAR